MGKSIFFLIILYRGDAMYFGLGLGVGFSLCLIFGINLSRLIWPEYNESIWDKKKRENKMVDDAIKSRLDKQNKDEGYKK